MDQSRSFFCVTFCGAHTARENNDLWMQIFTWSFPKLTLYHTFPLGLLERIEISHPLQHDVRPIVLVCTIKIWWSHCHAHLFFVEFNHSLTLSIDVDWCRSLKFIATSRRVRLSSITEAGSNGTDPRTQFAAKTSSGTVTFVFCGWSRVIALLCRLCHTARLVLWIIFQGNPLGRPPAIGAIKKP